MTTDLSGVRSLAGVHVLDFGMNIAGPQATSLLADLGAEVIKVESPAGDTSRGFTPRPGGISVMFAAMNRNKQYLGLDLTKPEAADVLRALLQWADVVVQNLRPGKAEQLGIGAEQCHAVNPRIVHASVEAFYPAEGARPGYDLLVQAETGLMSLTGPADAEPSRLPGSLLDHITGLWTAFGITAALAGPREKTALTISMSDVAQELISDRVSHYLATDEVPTRMGSAIGTSAPLQAYRCSDGDIVVGAVSNALFQKLAALVAPDITEDPDFATPGDRVANRDEMNRRLQKGFLADTVANWYEKLDAAGVPVGQVRDMPDAVARHREMSRTGLRAVDGLPGVEVLVNPLGALGPLPKPGVIGADSRRLLTDVLGLTAEVAQRLTEQGVLLAPDASA